MKKLLMFFSNRRNLMITVFLLAFFGRMALIYIHRAENANIDLSIYRETGRLVNSGVNPYDYSDQKDLRNSLRTDGFAYDEYVSQNQDAWDYYTSSNLPLSTFYYAFIDKLSGHPLMFRIIFALLDSLLGVVVALFLLKYLDPEIKWPNLLIVTVAAAFSPTLLLHGTVIPEDKGVQTLLMLSSLYLAKERKIIPSAVLLGFSVAFKGLGVFIYPLAAYLITGEPSNIFKLKTDQVKKALIFTLIFIISAGIWFLPYMPGILEMMKGRISGNMGAGVEPGHASIWTVVFNRFPERWKDIKNITMLFFSAAWIWFFVIKKLNIGAICLYLLVLFVDVMLLQGSLDRMNIGIIVSMVAFCLIDKEFSKILIWYTVISGLLFFTMPVLRNYSNLTRDASYTIAYLVIFLSYPFYLMFRKEKYASADEA
jgi:hypothetical protein